MSKWRLPTINELHSAFDYESGEPRMDWFNPKIYWSSTTQAKYTKYAWVVNFSIGDIFDHLKSDISYVCCVREAEDGTLGWSKSSKDQMTWHEAYEYCKRMNNE